MPRSLQLSEVHLERSQPYSSRCGQCRCHGSRSGTLGHDESLEYPWICCDSNQWLTRFGEELDREES